MVVSIPTTCIISHVHYTSFKFLVHAVLRQVDTHIFASQAVGKMIQTLYLSAAVNHFYLNPAVKLKKSEPLPVFLIDFRKLVFMFFWLGYDMIISRTRKLHIYVSQMSLNCRVIFIVKIDAILC